MTDEKINRLDIDHEGRISRLEEAVEQVCENHIPHLWSAVKEMMLWVRGIAIGVGLTLIGIGLKWLLGG